VWPIWSSVADIVVADIVCGRYRRSQWRDANVIVMKAYDYNLRYYPKSNTRGNKYKLLNHTFHYDTRKYSFSARVVNIWNSMPNFVVDVDTVCLFKARLNKFWMH